MHVLVHASWHTDQPENAEDNQQVERTIIIDLMIVAVELGERCDLAYHITVSAQRAIGELRDGESVIWSECLDENSQMGAVRASLDETQGLIYRLIEIPCAYASWPAAAGASDVNPFLTSLTDMRFVPDDLEYPEMLKGDALMRRIGPSKLIAATIQRYDILDPNAIDLILAFIRSRSTHTRLE